MKAEYLADGTIAVSGATRIETFNTMLAGIGWPDKDSGHLCVVGEKTDGRYHALWEKTGGLWELGDSAIQARDRFLVESFWVDGRDTLATSYLRSLNNLCFHDDSASNPPSTGMARNGTMKQIRVTDAPPFATVMQVSEKVTTNFRSALEKTRGVIVKGQLLIHEANCPKLLYTIRQPLGDLFDSPVMKALVWVISALDAIKGFQVAQDRSSCQWYTNALRLVH